MIRQHPLSCGYIGDNTSGALVMHDLAATMEFGGATIELGVGIPADIAFKLGEELDAVLKKIHEAQRSYTQ